MYLVGYLYEDYHDARSFEHKVKQFIPPLTVQTLHKSSKYSFCNTIPYASSSYAGMESIPKDL